jgi:ketosteroid isomerase-like protein
VSLYADRFRLVVELFDERGATILDDPEFRALIPELIHPEIECRSDDAILSGTFRGIEGYERFVREWNEVWEDMHWEIEELVERDEEIAAVLRNSARGQASGLEIETRVGYFLGFRDGKLARWRVYNDPADALAQLRR